MDNSNINELSQWVEDRTTLLAPPAHWEPDPKVARARFEARLRRRSALERYWLVGAVAASLLCAVLLVNPRTRALAQQLWQWITVGGIEVVRVDFDSLPEEARSLEPRLVNQPAPPHVVDDMQEAAQRVGFAPRLPRPGILSGTPQISILDSMLFVNVLKVADLELALQKAGVSDEAIPRDWDGAQLTLQIGATVAAEWVDVMLIQGLPPVLSTPPGFDLGAFSTAVLRAVGMKRETARRFGHRMITEPALLLGIGTEGEVAIREVRLHTGPATLIEDFSDNGQLERVTILWSVPDRVYVLSGAFSADLATAVANSID
jgi:hypothetical protein